MRPRCLLVLARRVLTLKIAQGEEISIGCGFLYSPRPRRIPGQTWGFNHVHCEDGSYSWRALVRASSCSRRRSWLCSSRTRRSLAERGRRWWSPCCWTSAISLPVTFMAPEAVSCQEFMKAGDIAEGRVLHVESVHKSWWVPVIGSW